MDLPPPPARAAAPTRARPRVIDPLAGLTADPFDTVHRRNAPASNAAPVAAPTRAPGAAGASPSARGTQIFTDL